MKTAMWTKRGPCGTELRGCRRASAPGSKLEARSSKREARSDIESIACLQLNSSTLHATLTTQGPHSTLHSVRSAV
eukprot:2678301-Rhodomonas_salina.2